jgi:hypothetical protein
MKRAAAGPAVLALALAACGGDDGDGVTPVGDATGPDAPTDARVIDAPVVCTVSTEDFGDAGALTPSLCIQDPGDDATTENDDVIVMRAPLEAGTPFDELELQLWAGYGALENGFASGTYPITGDELRYSTCGVCVFLSTDRTDESTYVDDYFATGGTVTLTSVDGVLTGSVSGLTFEHVTLDSGDTEPVGDGCDTAVGAATFTAPLTPPPMNKPGARAPRRGLKAAYAARRAR